MPIIRRTKPWIDWSGALSQEATQIILDLIRENAARHIGSFGHRENDNIDWHETGHLMGDAKAYKGGVIKWFAYYSSLVNKKHPFADGLSEEDKKKIAPKLQKAMAKGLRIVRG